MTEFKICSKCKKSLPVISFYKRKKSNDGLGYICKECSTKKSKKYHKENKNKINEQHRKYRKKKFKENPNYYKVRNFKMNCRKYDLTVQKACYIILIEQNMKCKICGKNFKDIYSPHFDHDHPTKKFRGFLCRHCNSMIGFSHDTPQNLRNGAKYLEDNGK